jgi:uncharacterized protein DUF3592
VTGRPGAIRVFRFAFVLAGASLALACGMIDRMTGVKTACDLRASGIPAQAEILSIWETGISVNEEPVIGIRLRVLAEDQPPFEATIPKALIGRLQVPQFQPGSHVPVIYDPKNPSRVGLDIYACR